VRLLIEPAAGSLGTGVCFKAVDLGGADCVR
jgi:hypothetical protein